VLQNPDSCLRLLGHIHVHQAISEKAYYCGALERLTWGEILNDPAIYIHKVYDDGQITTESLKISEMGAEGVPRPAINLTLECKEMSSEEAIEAAHAALDAQPLDEHLVQLTLKDAPRDIYAIHYEDSLTKRALQRAAFALKVRVRIIEDTMPISQLTGEDPSISDPVPGVALSEAYRGFAQETGDDDLIELGASIIAEASGGTNQ
jgi:DNA repair exonuclease SbcCD nuclease subunit